MTLLTPLGALAVVALLVPLVAVAAAIRRVSAVRAVLGLRPPRHGLDVTALAALTAVFVLLALAAMQPALAHDSPQRVRSDAQALFVLDTSRSMSAAPGVAQPTRLARAKAVAVRLRAAIPDVESGVATLTDRVLPDLLPVADVASFDGTVQHAVGIEEPPPSATSVRATSFAALTAVPSTGFFAPQATHRVIVLLTDGESAPFDPGAVARGLARTQLVVVRIRRGDESIFGPSGRPEAGYRPDPAAPAELDALAAATGGRVFAETDVGGASRALRSALGSGSTVSVTGRTRRETPLGRYVALVALAPLALLVLRRST